MTIMKLLKTSLNEDTSLTRTKSFVSPKNNSCVQLTTTPHLYRHSLLILYYCPDERVPLYVCSISIHSQRPQSWLKVWLEAFSSFSIHL